MDELPDFLVGVATHALNMARARGFLAATMTTRAAPHIRVLHGGVCV